MPTTKNSQATDASDGIADCEKCGEPSDMFCENPKCPNYRLTAIGGHEFDPECGLNYRGYDEDGNRREYW